MYIQQGTGEGAVQPPKEYHGTAFQAPQDEALPPETEQAEMPEAPRGQEEEPQAAPTMGRGHQAPPRGKEGLLSRFPLLSSLLPPTRGEGAHSDLFTWVLLGAAVLLFLDDRTDDILPLLLILLLWE